MFSNDEQDLKQKLIGIRLERKQNAHCLSVSPAGSGLCAAVGRFPDSAGTGPAATQPGQGGSCGKQPFPREGVLQRSTGTGDI